MSTENVSNTPDTVGEFPNLRLTPEKAAEARAYAESVGADPDRWVRMIEHNLNDAEVRADMEHVRWHQETRTPMDGSCPKGCRVRTVEEFKQEFGLE